MNMTKIAKNEKRQISITREIYDNEYSTVDELISLLQKCDKDYCPEITSESYIQLAFIEIRETRMETDEEFKNRMQREEDLKKRQEEDEKEKLNKEKEYELNMLRELAEKYNIKLSDNLK